MFEGVGGARGWRINGGGEISGQARSKEICRSSVRRLQRSLGVSQETFFKRRLMATVQADAKERPHAVARSWAEAISGRAASVSRNSVPTRHPVWPRLTRPSASRAAGVRINAISSRGQRSATVRANLLFMDAGIGGNVKE